MVMGQLVILFPVMPLVGRMLQQVRVFAAAVGTSLAPTLVCRTAATLLGRARLATPISAFVALGLPRKGLYCRQCTEV